MIYFSYENTRFSKSTEEKMAPAAFRRFGKNLLLSLVIFIGFFIFFDYLYVGLFQNRRIKVKATRSYQCRERFLPSTPILIPDNFALPTVVRKVLASALVNKVELVTLQPSLLLPLLGTPRRRLLEQRRVLPFAEGSQNVVTFGVVSINGSNLKNMTRSLSSEGFVYETEVTKDDAGVNLTSQHHFLLKDDLLVHLVVLKRRSNFFFVKAINSLTPRTAAKFSVGDLFIGRTDVALERFWIENVTVSSCNLPVPQPLLQFVAYLKWSRFLECNFEVNATYRRKYPSADNKLLDSSFKNVMPCLKEIFDSTVAPFWLASGTLLGWYRQCGITPHTQDIDVAAYKQNDAETIYNAVKNHEQLIMTRVFGYPERAFEFTVSSLGVPTDVFFVQEEEDHQWYAVHQSKSVFFQLLFSKSSFLCSAELLGLKVLVPCDPEKIIKEEYGNEWTVPDENWDYALSSRNRGKHFVWSLRERRIIFEKYKIN